MNYRKVEDIVIPEIMRNPIKSGINELDKQISIIGGIIPSQVMMFTASPGAGKTTLSMVMLDNLCKSASVKRPGLFMSLEMSDFQLKMQTERLGRFKNVLILGEEDIPKNYDIEDIIKDIERLNPSIVIVDSIQNLSLLVGGRPIDQIKIVSEFKSFAKRTFIPVVLIGHVNKGGDYKGNSTIMHDVDTHIEILRDSETLENYIAPKKNRFGGVFDPIRFQILSDGVIIGANHYSKEGGIKPFFDIDRLGTKEDIESVKDTRNNVSTEDIAGMAKFYSDRMVNLRMSNNKLNLKSATITIATIFDYLKKRYINELKSMGKLGVTYKIKQKTGTIKYDTAENEMTFGLSRILKNPNGLGYKTEKPYIRSYCKNPHDYMVWAIMHEFCHIYVPDHSSMFYAKLNQVAKENKFLFSI